MKKNTLNLNTLGNDPSRWMAFAVQLEKEGNHAGARLVIDEGVRRFSK